MSRRNKEANKAKQMKLEENNSDGSEEECPVNESTPNKKKRACLGGDDSIIQKNFSQEMTKLLESFNSDVSKCLMAKRKRLEQYTQDSIRATTRRVLEATKIQTCERKKLLDEFRKQLSAFIQQAETELDKAKESEDKLQKLIQQQQRFQLQVRGSQSKRLKTLKLLGEEFFKGIEELESKHIDQYSAVQADLRKEMALLQKKILMDTQQQEMLNVRKNLQSMLL
ncbi:synaptonemal complex protein 3-like [Centruroides sculpturatus]|uniref:synaptonemal complex protein 3-like n=1 Tax=Centruroides sculpturatus TaxID=218467 RepID=UPI000C6CDEFD|nr:synaptonemal complex protein 3-like [Centruroides sculpturatus]XP_023244274.1 synaptonemal complex protein 3-like [Centruroides sculpturatus]